MFLREQIEGASGRTIRHVRASSSGGQISITVPGYGTKAGGNEDPIIVLEIVNGRLQVNLWSDINVEDPRYKVDMEHARIPPESEMLRGNLNVCCHNIEWWFDISRCRHTVTEIGARLRCQTIAREAAKNAICADVPSSSTLFATIIDQNGDSHLLPGGFTIVRDPTNK